MYVLSLQYLIARPSGKKEMGEKMRNNIIFIFLLSAFFLQRCADHEKILLKNNLKGVQHIGIPVNDIEQSKAWYTKILGFQVVHEPIVPGKNGDIKVAFLKKGDITLELYQLAGESLNEIKNRDHGHIDHFAIDVLEIDKALKNTLAEGAILDESTPDGPKAIDVFWSKGVKYVILKGPNGEKVELNQRFDLDKSRRKENLGGWSHLGIPITDLEKSKHFYRQFGFKEIMYTEIPIGDESINVSMMEKDQFVIELYQLYGDNLVEISQRKDGHIDHIAFDVIDIDKAYQEIKEAGFEIFEDAPVYLDFWDNGVKYFNIRGPDGEKLEFNEIIRP